VGFTANLAEESATQQSLLDHLPEITEQYLARERKETRT
jgi:hypothetical protein